MIVRKLRLQRGWSQEQLAEMSGVSVRTIQRLERGQPASSESLKALGAVFQVDYSELAENTTMKPELDLHDDERRALKQVREIKAFYTHAIQYAITVLLLTIVNVVWSPNHLWVSWVAFGWGIGLAVHGLNVFEVLNFFGADWERRQVEKRLGRKL